MDVEVEQPLAHLISHMISGSTAQIAIKLYGDDLDTLEKLANKIKASIENVPGVSSLAVEPMRKVDEVHIKLRPESLAFYGVDRAYVGAFVLDSRFGLDRGFDRYDDDVESGRDEVDSSFVAQRPGTEVLASALDWLGSRNESSPPFFAFIHFYDPHTPYEGGYRSEVARVDSLVGELLTWLDARGLDERTLIALTSDHGESLGEHGEATQSEP